MSRASHASPLLRGAALAVMVSLAAAGGDLPICFTLLAQATTPCEMHVHRAHAGAHAGDADAGLAGRSGPQLLAAGTGHMCHGESSGLPCATGGACPSGGATAVAWTNTPEGERDLAQAPLGEPPAALSSYLAPPPSPPPQA